MLADSDPIVDITGPSVAELPQRVQDLKQVRLTPPEEALGCSLRPTKTPYPALDFLTTVISRL